MRKLKTSAYQIDLCKPQVPDGEIRLVFLTDFHNQKDPAFTARLLNRIREFQPDHVLVGGDMLVGTEGTSTDIAGKFMRALADEYDVTCALGNHEYRMCIYPERFGTAGEEYLKELQSYGISVLRNATRILNIQGMPVAISGLEIPARNYKKFRTVPYPLGHMQEHLGEASGRHVHILLAHNPVYMDTYRSWGSDIILSGHMHGGIIRVFGRPLIGTDGHFFPKNSYGIRQVGGVTSVISAGLGEHTIPLRIANPRELVCLTVRNHSAGLR